MSSQVDALRSRWSAFPPLVRWGLMLALLIIAFVLVNDYAWATAARLNNEANEIARTLDRARDARDALRGDLERTVVARGAIRLPMDENAGTQAMADAVNEIVQRRSGIGGYSYDTGAVSRLAPNVMTGVIRPGFRGARVTGEVKFEATPDDAMAVIAEIESHPSIQGIARVQMTRAAQRRVAVLLTVETWVTTGLDTPGRFGR